MRKVTEQISKLEQFIKDHAFDADLGHIQSQIAVLQAEIELEELQKQEEEAEERAQNLLAQKLFFSFFPLA